MVTYPSTHGVFEDTITELCALVHDAGGQVYVDGANLNALVGLAQPGKFGADVSHLNLHKTFCIPHGGGGPGVGPVGGPRHTSRPTCRTTRWPRRPGPRPGWGRSRPRPTARPASCRSRGPTCGSWAAPGCTRATQVAVLNANYVAARLREHYPVLYSGHDGLVAHECILDLRDLTKRTGVTVDDVAKRLIDYGFHAPTMSFPVAGTLMVEPTESEDRYELDRFCDAMIAIRGEIAEVEAGEVPLADSMLRNAPHTASGPGRQVGLPLRPVRGGLPCGGPRPGQVLAAGEPDRRRLRRPPPGLLLPAAGGVLRLTLLSARLAC